MSSANQFFLTPAEAERTRETLKGRLQKSKKLSGQPRVSVEPRQHYNEVVSASLMADMSSETEPSKGRSDSMKAFIVGNQYLPCTIPLQDLQPMELSDLRMDVQHRGRVLTVKRIARVVELVTRSWTVVQEGSSGQTERLELFLHKSRNGEDILESASTFMIKDPFYTLNDHGEATIRIDHPSDLVLSPHNEVITGLKPSSKVSKPAPKVRTAKECKEDGNAALKQKELLGAHASYTEGLRLVADNAEAKDNLAYDILRNRAHVNLLMNRLDEAKADAVAAVTNVEDQNHRDLDSKAYFRAGCAAYSLGEHQEAQGFFEAQQSLSPNDKDATANLQKIEVRLREQATGTYDFDRIQADLRLGRPRIDAANFTRNTMIKESHGHGRGVYATSDMNPGDIILCEKSFCVVWGHEDAAWTAMTYDIRDDMIRGFPAGLSKAIVQKLLNNPSQVEKVMDLFGDYAGVGKELIMADNYPVIDTFQVHDIIARNAFGPGPVSIGGKHRDEDVSNSSTGLWVMAAYVNHSCIPNAKKEYMGDLMVLRATRRIRASEEITHSYDESSDYDARQTALWNTWGFKCDCPLCTAEKADNPDLRKKRQSLVNEANILMEKEVAPTAKRLAVTKAERLALSIDETYDDERYNCVPRVALLGIKDWIARAKPSSDPSRKTKPSRSSR